MTLSQRDYLAMTCFYLHSVTTENVIASLFNCSVSTCSRNIQLTLHRMEVVLPTLKECEMRWPSTDKERLTHVVKILNNLVRKGHDGRYIKGYPIGTMDGCSFPIYRHRNIRIADRYYATWKRKHTVSNLFVWSPDGTIMHAIYNAPGAIPDSVLASEAYRQTTEMRGHNYTILADSAFNRHGGKIITA